MKPILQDISFTFKQGETSYTIKYSPIDKPGKYDVSFFINGNYIISFLSHMSANKTHAAEFMQQGILFLRDTYKTGK